MTNQAVRDLGEHTLTATPGDGGIVWSCECGWTTIEYHGNPPHHTDVDDRVAEHIREVAAMLDGTAMDGLPSGHQFEMFLRRRLDNREPADIVVWAVWLGGFRPVKTWNWNDAGLAEALAWLEEYPATSWQGAHGGVVTADDLTRRVANAI